MAERDTDMGARIRALREDAGQTQPEVATACGVSYSAYQAWEAGAIPKPANIRRLAAHFDRTTAFILTGADAPDESAPGQLDRIEEKLDQLLETITRQHAETLAQVLRMGGQRERTRRGKPPRSNPGSDHQGSPG
jgi:transcriptional regulator with XRE-family HTH domain